VEVQVDGGKGVGSLALSLGSSLDKMLKNDGSVDLADNVVLLHVLDDEGSGLIEGLLTGVDVELVAFGSLVGVRNTGELWNFTSAGLLVESLDITLLADFERCGDVALVELEAGSLVELLGKITVLGIRRDEGDKDDDAGHVEELGDFGDSSDVLGTVLS
jgi:hypothetical protein